MKPNRMLKVAAWLWMAAVLTASMLVPGITQAKYTASATGTAAGQVARWEVGEQIEVEDVLEPSPAKLVFAQGKAYEETQIKLVNNSEVTARYLLTPTVDSSSVPLNELIGFKLPGESSYTHTWPYIVDMPFPTEGTPTEVYVDVIVHRANFTGLRIDARVEQVD